MAQIENDLRFEIKSAVPGANEKIKALLEKEFRVSLGYNGYAFSNGDFQFCIAGLPIGDVAHEMMYFSTAEKLLVDIEKIMPGFEGSGSWTISYIGADAGSETWEFEWSNAQITNVVNKSMEAYLEAQHAWDDLFEQSELLEPAHIDDYYFDMLPEDALWEIETDEDPDDYADDDETITYGDIVRELKRILD